MLMTSVMFWIEPKVAEKNTDSKQKPKDRGGAWFAELMMNDGGRPTVQITHLKEDTVISLKAGASDNDKACKTIFFACQKPT
jgi:hypothetical protein